MQLPVIVIGGGGHSKVLLSTLHSLNRRVLGFVDPEPGLLALNGVAHLGDDCEALRYLPEQVRLVNGVGAASSTDGRKAVYEKFKAKHYVFESLAHPSATVAAETQLEEGVQLMAGAVLQPGSRLGENVIINTGARVDHDCWIEAHAHIAPGAVLCGNVSVEKGAFIGAGATILPGIKIGAGSLVGAGAVVVEDVPPGVTVVGTPARLLVRSISQR
jgi:sugar O-acyltransferase (sialic acid O-acetyltransferase NeuD family)